MSDTKPRRDRSTEPIAAAEIDMSARFYVAETVYADGSITFWLMDSEHRGANHGTVPAHEMTGPLPRSFQERVAGVIRCGAPTSVDGSPCRTRVGRRGERCKHHDPERKCGAATSTTGAPCRIPVDHPGERCIHHKGRPMADGRLF